MTWHSHVAAFASIAVLTGACSDAPTACGDLERNLVESSLEGAHWRGEADRLLAEAPADSILMIIIMMPPQTMEAFVAWAESTGGGFEGLVPIEGFPGSVDRVIIRYRFSGISAFSVFMPVWALDGLKNLDGIRGVEWGRSGDHALC